jgi:hypothetical protein
MCVGLTLGYIVCFSSEAKGADWRTFWACARMEKRVAWIESREEGKNDDEMCWYCYGGWESVILRGGEFDCCC